MAKVDQPFRERSLEYQGGSSTSIVRQDPEKRLEEMDKLLRALVETWNRELTPLMLIMREEVVRMGGEVQVLSADYIVLRSDRRMLVDATAGQVTLTMPPSADVQDYPFLAEKIDSSSNTVVLDFGTETCSGANTVTLTAQYVAVSVVSNGAGYYIESNYP